MSSPINMSATARAIHTFTPEHLAHSTVDSLNQVDWLNRHHPAWMPKMMISGREIDPAHATNRLGKEAESMICSVDVGGRKKNALLRCVGLMHCAALPVRK